MRYLILGSQGFIGKGLYNLLKKEKVSLIRFDNFSNNIRYNICSNDIIINCLGKNRNDETFDQLKDLIKFIRIKKKNILWVQLSTPLVYDQEPKNMEISENTKEIPFNKYALSKLSFDNYLKRKKNNSFNYLILRISTVYDKKMKSKIFSKLKLINKSVFRSIIIDKNTIINYVSLNELAVYIYKLSKNRKSRNKLFVISQNIRLVDLLNSSKEKSKPIHKIFIKFKGILKFFFKEPLLFLTNQCTIRSKNLNKFTKIENRNLSHKKLIKFFR